MALTGAAVANWGKPIAMNNATMKTAVKMYAGLKLLPLFFVGYLEAVLIDSLRSQPVERIHKLLPIKVYHIRLLSYCEQVERPFHQLLPN